MTNTERMTNRKALEYAVENLRETAPADVLEKLKGMIAQIEKKNASPKKLTAQQEKNEALKSEILDYLSTNADNGYTVSDLLKFIPALEGDSNQHVSALLRALRLEGLVETYSEKRRTYFRAVVGE